MDLLTPWVSPRFRRRRLAGLSLTFLLCLNAGPTHNAASEYELKAAFLYKFASFVAWPDSNAADPICIGVVGEDPFGSALDDVVKGKSMNGRTFEIRRLRPGQEPGKCHILFVARSEKKKLRSLLDHIQGPVLTVGDMPEFCENGGVIRLGLEDNRVRIEVNLEAAERAGLQLSSKLLSLARIVRPAASSR